MAYTASTLPVEVVVLGSAKVVEDVYKGDGSTTFVKGDLVRITSTGTIKDAAAANAGCVHGMVLETWATAPAATQYVKVLVFGADTVLKIQVVAAAIYTSFAIGARYELANPSAGIWTLTTTTTQGVAEVVKLPSDETPTIANDLLTNGCVFVRIPQSILDVAKAS